MTGLRSARSLPPAERAEHLPVFDLVFALGILAAVSGGNTPALFFRTLSTRDDVPWDKVTITLVDERWVDDSSDRSNAKLVKANLWHGPAASAKFVPLFRNAHGLAAPPDEISAFHPELSGDSRLHARFLQEVLV